MRQITILILVLLSLPSCSDPYLNSVLDKASEQMDQHPDSSLLLLRSIDASRIKTPSAKARYSLELAMALDKEWIDTTDIGIIQPAIHYYRGPLRKREQFLSKYYLARILENGQHYPEAIEALSDAEHCFSKQADSVYLIRIASAKARIYTYQFIQDKAEQALLDAVRYSRELKDLENEQRMMLSLADYYEATRQYDSKTRCYLN